jgi:MSHA pilin protein MshD
MMRQRGISLIELIMFIVIISVALAGILLVMNTTNKSSSDPLVTKQALAIAESLLEEIELQPFTYCEPDVASAVNATAATVAQCGNGGVEVMGPETESGVPETRGSNTTPFDNVNDYSGYNMAAGAITTISNVNTGVNGYSAAVTMTQPTTFNGIAGTDANGAPQVLLINVTVQNANGYAVTLEGYRTRYSPRAAP